MPGILRPYTLIDILATINDQAGQQQADSTALTAPLSSVAEADEQTTVSDSATGSVRAPQGWDQGVWGGSSWS